MNLNRKQIEMIVLSVGIAIILIALFMMFFNSSPESIFWTNLIFAIGFLVYILYSMMTTNSLNREIGGLNSHIKSLKEDVRKKEQTISEKTSQIDRLKKESNSTKEELQTAQSEVERLKKEIDSLKAS